MVPTWFKSTTIVIMPKKYTVSCLNDYRPVALALIITEYFERLVLSPIDLDLVAHQLEYRAHRLTEDTIIMALTHL